LIYSISLVVYLTTAGATATAVVVVAVVVVLVVGPIRCPHKTGKVRKSNNEARLSNHCYSGKAVSTTYSECVCVALGIRHATRM
jgi:hypothetical protein